MSIRMQRPLMGQIVQYIGLTDSPRSTSWIAWLSKTVKIRRQRPATDGFERGYEEGRRGRAYNDGCIDTRRWADLRWLAAHGGACVVHPGAKQCGYGQAYRQGYYRGISDSWTKRRGDPSTAMFCCLINLVLNRMCEIQPLRFAAGKALLPDVPKSVTSLVLAAHLGDHRARPPDRRRFGVLAKLIQHLHDHLHHPRCSCDQPRVGSSHSTLSRWQPWRSDTRRPVGRSNQDDLCRSTTGQACTERVRTVLESPPAWLRLGPSWNPQLGSRGLDGSDDPDLDGQPLPAFSAGREMIFPPASTDMGTAGPIAYSSIASSERCLIGSLPSARAHRIRRLGRAPTCRSSSARAAPAPRVVAHVPGPSSHGPA